MYIFIKIKQFLIIFVISLIAFTESANAIAMAINYKQGIYTISKVDGPSATAKLLTPNNVTSLIVIDSNSNEKFYKRFDTVDEIITLSYIQNGDSIVIADNGEISINFSS